MDSIESLKHKNGLKRRKQPQQQVCGIKCVRVRVCVCMYLANVIT